MGERYVESGMIVTAPDGRYIEPRTFADYYHQILDGCGLRHFTFHALRHTFATRAMEQGMEPKTLSMLLGHYSVSFTLDTYAHVLDNQKIESMGLMEELFDAPATTAQARSYPVIIAPQEDGSMSFVAPDFPSVNFMGTDYLGGLQYMKERIEDEILTLVIVPEPTPIEGIGVGHGEVLIQVVV